MSKEPIGVRLDPAMMADVEEFRKQLASSPHMEISLSVALRVLIGDALDAWKKRAKK